MLASWIGGNRPAKRALAKKIFFKLSEFKKIIGQLNNPRVSC